MIFDCLLWMSNFSSSWTHFCVGIVVINWNNHVLWIRGHRVVFHSCLKMKNSWQNLNLWCMNRLVLCVNQLVTLESWISYFCTVWIDSPIFSDLVNQFMAVQGGFFTDQLIHQSSLTCWRSKLHLNCLLTNASFIPCYSIRF
jgi:hypothetical protein